MKRIVITITALCCLLLVSTKTVQAEENGKQRRGLLGGLLQQVESTVNETVNAVGDVVGSVVEGVDKTVEDTVSLTKETVETLTDLEEKKPVSKIVDKTVKHVGKTVENVEPVLKNTTKTVDTVTSEVIGVTEELPELPVVTPVVDEVGKVVDKTAQTVTGTVDKTVDKTVETVNELPVVVEEVTKPVKELPVVVEEIVKPIKPERNPEISEVIEPSKPEAIQKPAVSKTPERVNEKNEFTDNAEVDSALQAVDTTVSEPVEQTKPEVTESATDITLQPTAQPETFEQETKPFAEEAIAEIPNKSKSQTKTVNGEIKTIETLDKTMKQATPVKPESPAIPPNKQSLWNSNPVTITTATTSVSSVSVAHTGVADFFNGIVNWLDMQVLLEGRQWILLSEIMRNQWTHAPPGQPPQLTPFLQISIQN
ncbi:hypothetical protein H9649_09750 [Sporosarcina sp. Sa2YVA2]|uniref:Uncharacterized protein n=1 Tax=Sporosarcina quadrami TaxID=2762234 RepID=A0ABR8UA23_9BACL|nr:hypothetical protein [Sporosarcina quadrami]MBD7984867.1 hypothetical protein [Sporosarcina quadrami]